MTTTTNLYASTIVPMATTAMEYAKAVCVGIEQDKAGRQPEGVDCNTPAWVMGHLAIYPDRVLEMIGRGDIAQTDDRYQELFKAGTPSPDDADGTYYPPMAELLDRFVSRTGAALEALASADPSAFEAENPVEGRFREMFPTVGGACGFLLCGHTMMHLGQISTWRRCMGLGSAM